MAIESTDRQAQLIPDRHRQHDLFICDVSDAVLKDVMQHIEPRQVFDDPDSFRLDRDPAGNLLYGAGIHVCPGAPLACMELEELLGWTSAIAPDPNQPATPTAYPASGFRSLYLLIS